MDSLSTSCETALTKATKVSDTFTDIAGYVDNFAPVADLMTAVKDQWNVVGDYVCGRSTLVLLP